MTEAKRSLEECVAELRELTHYSRADYGLLEERLGRELLRRRLNRQLDLYDRHRTGPDRTGVRWRHTLVRRLVRAGLTGVGLMSRARRNARNPMRVERDVALPGLPSALDGFRVLQLSDFHFDFIPELPELLREQLCDLAFDVCVITGDFRGETTGPYEESLEHLARIRPWLGERVYTVLGNHDNVELLLRFSDLGVRCLMNEAVPLERRGGAILLAGVDDCHHYRTHDFALIRDLAPAHPATLLLSHSPECYQHAEAAGVDLLLAGHTHGGQICLPGGIPVMGHIGKTPRTFLRGEWRYGNMQGYTSRGIGCSSLDVRLNCPPELTVHTLRRGDV